MDDAQHQVSAIARELSSEQARWAIVCPLCGAAVPMRGLRARPTGKTAATTATDVQLAFACPACGLVTAFRTAPGKPVHLPTHHGSAWTRELRRFRQTKRAEWRRYEGGGTQEHFIAVAGISFLTWLVLTGSLYPVDLLWGLLMSLVVAQTSYRFVAFNVPRWLFEPRRWLYFLDVLVELTRQMIIQNVRLSILVFTPGMSIRPGIVVVPTTIKDEAELTILGSLMSLTPDTVTMDVDTRRGLIYVHWINVETTDPEEARELISAGLEDKIIRWLH